MCSSDLAGRTKGAPRGALRGVRDSLGLADEYPGLPLQVTGGLGVAGGVDAPRTDDPVVVPLNLVHLAGSFLVRWAMPWRLAVIANAPPAASDMCAAKRVPSMPTAMPSPSSTNEGAATAPKRNFMASIQARPGPSTRAAQLGLRPFQNHHLAATTCDNHCHSPMCSRSTAIL